jgi:hypothetical protein
METTDPRQFDYHLAIQRTYENNKRKVYLLLMREDSTTVSIPITKKKSEEILALIDIPECS